MPCLGSVGLCCLHQLLGLCYVRCAGVLRRSLPVGCIVAGVGGIVRASAGDVRRTWASALLDSASRGMGFRDWDWDSSGFACQCGCCKTHTAHIELCAAAAGSGSGRPILLTGSPPFEKGGTWIYQGYGAVQCWIVWCRLSTLVPPHKPDEYSVVCGAVCCVVQLLCHSSFVSIRRGPLTNFLAKCLLGSQQGQVASQSS